MDSIQTIMIRVTVTKDGAPFLTLALPKDDIIIGRGAEADVQLTSEAVSRRHARLTRVGAAWQVADLGAANGVYVARAGRSPERVVIQPLEPGDRIHIETFVISLEDVKDPVATLEDLHPRDFEGEESSLESNRTQFISMVDVLAARERASDPTVTGPIMRFISEEAGPVLEHAPAGEAPKPSASSTSGPSPAAPAKSAGVAAVSAATASNAWFARMTSPSGHERNFTLTTDKVNVGAAESCQIQLPAGPSVIVELERVGREVMFRRVPFWPFPRVIVDGRAEKRGYLADGDSFLVGEFEVTVNLRRGG